MLQSGPSVGPLYLVSHLLLIRTCAGNIIPSQYRRWRLVKQNLFLYDQNWLIYLIAVLWAALSRLDVCVHIVLRGARAHLLITELYNWYQFNFTDFKHRQFLIYSSE